MKVKFSFGSGQRQVADIVEIEDDITDEELDKALSDWLWDKSDAHWVKVEEDVE